MKLNLGCGPDYRPGYVNVDFYRPDLKTDRTVDLTKFPWPFKSNSVDEVLMNHVLEHLIDTERTVREIHRVLKRGGVFRGQVPYCWSDNGVTEYGHVHLFHWFSFHSMEKVGFRCEISVPKVIRHGEPNWSWGRCLRNLLPGKKILSRVMLNIYDVIDFRLVKI